MLAFLALFLLSACASKKEIDSMRVYTKNNTYYKQLIKTEKTQLYDKNITKALLTATYVHVRTLDKNDTRNENFIIGLYLEDESKQSLDSKKYKLTLNGQAPHEVKELSTEDSRIKDLPFVTEWGSYYFVSFPHVESKGFSLVFESELYGKGELKFAKVAKYVLTKVAF